MRVVNGSEKDAKTIRERIRYLRQCRAYWRSPCELFAIVRQKKLTKNLIPLLAYSFFWKPEFLARLRVPFENFGTVRQNFPTKYSNSPFCSTQIFTLERWATTLSCSQLLVVLVSFLKSRKLSRLCSTHFHKSYIDRMIVGLTCIFCGIAVYHYRLNKRTGRRERNAITFVFDKEDIDENWKTGQLWHKAVNLLLRGICDISRDQILNRQWSDKRVLVIINPVSGRKKGMQTYWNIVAPMLVEASVKFKSLVTSGQGHAAQVIITDST